MPLTPAQQQRFIEDGYLVVEGVIPPETIRAMIDRIDWLCANWQSPEAQRLGLNQEADIAGAVTTEKSARTVRKLVHMATHELLFKSHAHNPVLLDMVDALIGRPGCGLYLYEDQAFLKPPRVGSSKQLHQDNAYFNVTPDDAVLTTWCALDDATVENGCMHYVPGSHTKGVVEHVQIPNTPHMVPKGYKLDDAVPAPVKSGGILFHHGSSLHYSPPNNSDKWRRAFACHYVRGKADCRSRKYEEMIRVR